MTVDRELIEAEKMALVPGIDFVDEPAGRRARIVGTSLGVWEVIETLHMYGDDLAQFQAYYEEILIEPQIQAALAYYRRFPDEIDLCVRENAAFDLERFWRENPATKPPWR